MIGPNLANKSENQDICLAVGGKGSFLLDLKLNGCRKESCGHLGTQGGVGGEGGAVESGTARSRKWER